jgi:hypothetical protein
MNHSNDGNGASVLIPTSEGRAVNRLSFYWDGIRKDRPIPSISDIDPRTAPVVWDSCFILVLDSPLSRSFFDYAGPLIAADLGFDPTGRPVNEVPTETLVSIALSRLDQAVRESRPVTLEGAAALAAGCKRAYRAVLLPLAGRGDAATGYVLGAISSRTVDRRADVIEARDGE